MQRPRVFIWCDHQTWLYQSRLKADVAVVRCEVQLHLEAFELLINTKEQLGTNLEIIQTAGDMDMVKV